MATVQQILDDGNPNTIGDMLKLVKLGTYLAGSSTPTAFALTGLASSATHIHPTPGRIVGINLAGTNKLLVYAGTAAAGEVKVTYTAGVATLVFGDGANTAYDGHIEGTTDLGAVLATVI